MNLSDAAPQRIQLGIERFLANESIAFRGVVFYKEGERALQVDSYSDWQPEKTTEDHAREKIAQSKIVLQELAALSDDFKKAAQDLPHEYFCCHGYGNGSFALAEEKNGAFKWLQASPAR
jgi:hypothetical protein